MPRKEWLLLDTHGDHQIRELCVGPRDVSSSDMSSSDMSSSDMGGRARGYRVRKRRLEGGARDGVDIVEIDNGSLQFTVLPTRGMGLWRARAGDLRLGWKSPVAGPVHPRNVPLFRGDGLGWLEGFDELLVRCGLESNGAPVFSPGGALLHPLHGRVANLSAHRLELAIDGDSGRIELTGTIDESRLYGQKLRLVSRISTEPGSTALSIHDEVVNLSSTPAELALLYHVNFGPPLLDAGARVVLPARSVVPQTPRSAEGISSWEVYEPPRPGFTEEVFLYELHGDVQGRSSALLRNAHGNFGASLAFNLKELPRFTVWKSTEAESDGYVTGLEPSINFPNHREFERQQGRLRALGPGERASFHLRLEAHPTAESVARAEQDVAEIAAGRAPIVHRLPQPGWSPEGAVAPNT